MTLELSKSRFKMFVNFQPPDGATLTAQVRSNTGAPRRAPWQEKFALILTQTPVHNAYACMRCTDLKIHCLLQMSLRSALRSLGFWRALEWGNNRPGTKDIGARQCSLVQFQSRVEWGPIPASTSSQSPLPAGSQCTDQVSTFPEYRFMSLRRAVFWGGEKTVTFRRIYARARFPRRFCNSGISWTNRILEIFFGNLDIHN